MALSGSRVLNVGLHLPTWEKSTDGTTYRWADILALAQYAEAIGFDSISAGDHLLMDFGDEERIGLWDTWSMLSALAASTSRVEIALVVAATAYRNPALLAKTAVTIDEISGGRLVLGLGAGWHEPEFRSFGFPFDHRASRFEEALTIITALLREGTVDFEGRFYQARECELRPRGPRPNGPPIMIGSKGPRMMRLTAQYADMWNRDFGPDNAISDLPGWRAKVDSACADVGRDPATLERTAAVWVDLPGAPRREEFGALHGSLEEIADSLLAFANEGFTQLYIWPEPLTLAGIEAFAPILEALHQGRVGV